MKKKHNILKRALRFIHKHKLRKFEPKIKFSLDRKNFIIKTAETSAELQAALYLRYEVFYKELLQQTKWVEVDFDRFDIRCDHLLVIEKSSGKVIGTYRMNSSLFSSKFYSATEFHIRQILEIPGNKLEIDRACVHQDYRNGRIISLLWEGIIKYFSLSRSSVMFGCSSIRTMDRKNIRNICEYFAVHGFTNNLRNINPRGKFRMREINRESILPKGHILNSNDYNIIKGNIPTLIYAYLKAGAKICSLPALDRRFECVDFLTVLEAKQLSPALIKKNLNNTDI